MWLTERAQVVEEMTGQLHTATRLLRLAQEFDPEEALTRQLSTVASLQDGLQGQLLCCHPCSSLLPTYWTSNKGDRVTNSTEATCCRVNSLVLRPLCVGHAVFSLL